MPYVNAMREKYFHMITYSTKSNLYIYLLNVMRVHHKMCAIAANVAIKKLFGFVLLTSPLLCPSRINKAKQLNWMAGEGKKQIMK